MIGVIADPADSEVVEEFFELFKTPWEFYRVGHQYEVVLGCADAELKVEAGTKLYISYAGSKKTAGNHDPYGFMLLYRERQIPIYGECETFPLSGGTFLRTQSSHACAGYIEQTPESAKARIGYNLFHEIRHLLTIGQPAANAAIPTLELHISLLRDLIVQQGIALTEIPPVPEGYKFIACLTHDVDHPSLRSHKFDHTALGFLYRALFGSLLSFVRGHSSFGNLLKNWVAALKLPFVYVGLAKDFWGDFDRQYLELEQGLPSTFFVIPFKDRAGNKGNGSAPKVRAACYGAADIADAIRSLTDAGCEVGLHGIDAWCDSYRGQAEVEEIRRLTGKTAIGVRMHWLYFGQQSPAALESAGAAYDSTMGYNETIGYRAGTTQAYKPLGSQNILELPLHVMDTAMFYPAHMGLSADEAKKAVESILDHAVEVGGCVTVNWHDRSLAPERLWNESYRELLKGMKDRGAWFVSASQAVAWFQKRRSVTFDAQGAVSKVSRSTTSASSLKEILGIRIRVYEIVSVSECCEYRDTNLEQVLKDRIPSSVSA